MAAGAGLPDDRAALPGQDEVAVRLHRGPRGRPAARAGGPDGGLPVAEDEVAVGLEHELELARGRVQPSFGARASSGQRASARPAGGQSGVRVLHGGAPRLPTIAAFPSSCRISFAPGVPLVCDAHTVPCGPCSTRFPSSCITALVTAFPAVSDAHTGTLSRASTRFPSAWRVSVSGRVLAVSEAPGKSASVARRRSPLAAAHSVTVPDCHRTLLSAP